ncbi:hypothetical protein KKF47_03135 [Patescibacteria group bacterium]|nr:hypothetical protein [Patescibacteria group bacterium]
MPEEQKVILNLKNLPPEEADLQKRIEGFDKELRGLLGKYELALGAQAKIAPNGIVVADPVLFSARKKEPEKKGENTLINPEE